MRWETREQWGAVPPRNRRYDVGLSGVAIHWPGADARFADMPHSSHQGYWRQWQQQHMARGSNDIEYSVLVCPCGIVAEARIEQDRPTVRAGCNGSSAANYSHAGVQFMLGTREQVRDSDLRVLGEAVAWLRSKGWGPSLVGHRDLYATSCPGDGLYSQLGTINSYATDPPSPPRRKKAPEMILIKAADSPAVALYGLRGLAGVANPADLQAIQRALADPTVVAEVSRGTWDMLAKANH